MKFNNRANLRHELPDGRVIWESRSVAVNGVILATIKDSPNEVRILCSERGPAVEDYPGLMNLVAGYIDWDESATEAFIRECWEEVGLNMYESIFDNPKCSVLRNDLHQPFEVSSAPDQNRQNVSLRFGMVVQFETVDDLPELSLEHNEIEGEAKDPQWMNLMEFGSYADKWAFNHDKVIMRYLNLVILKGIIKLTKD